MNKKLYRSKKDKKIAGIAGGLADYFDVDPIIVRILFVVSALAWGFSIVIYIVMWFIIPEEHSRLDYQEYSDAEDFAKSSFRDEIKVESEKHNGKAKFLFAYLLIFIGVIALLDNVFPFWNYYKLWPILLIAIGVFVIFNSKTKG